MPARVTLLLATTRALDRPRRASSTTSAAPVMANRTRRRRPARGRSGVTWNATRTRLLVATGLPDPPDPVAPPVGVGAGAGAAGGASGAVSVVIRPTWLASRWLNHRAPSGPVAMSPGAQRGGGVYSDSAPSGSHPDELAGARREPQRAVGPGSDPFDRGAGGHRELRERARGRDAPDTVDARGRRTRVRRPGPRRSLPRSRRRRGHGGDSELGDRFGRRDPADLVRAGLR